MGFQLHDLDICDICLLKGFDTGDEGWYRGSAGGTVQVVLGGAD